MVGVVERIELELAAVVADLNPSAVEASSVVPLFERFDRIERLASGAKTLLARRIDDTEEWKRRGYLSPAEFLAAKTGSSVGAAKDTRATSAKVAELPVIEQEMRTGQLSGAQIAVVADAVARAPGTSVGW